MKEINVGVIGAERRGRIAELAHQPENCVFLKAASTLHPERIEDMRKYGSDFLITDDYRKVLNDSRLDAVFVCTPDWLHEEHVLEAISAGKHVYLEKPMAISIEGCDRLINAAKEKGVLLYVGHNMRFFPVMQKMKQLIDSDAIGEVQAIWCRHFISYGGDAYFKDWHSEQRYSHGLLLQKGVHDIDIIQWLAGSFARRVVGMGKLSVYNTLPRRPEDTPSLPVVFNRNNWPPLETSGYSPIIDVEDHSMVLMQLESGVQASYTQCHYTPDDQRNYTIIGTRGRIENCGDHSTEEKWATVHLWNRRSGFSELGNEVFRIPPLTGSHGGADPLVVDDFIGALRGKKISGASSLDGRMAVAAGYLATESIRGNSRPYDVQKFVPQSVARTPVAERELVA